MVRKLVLVSQNRVSEETVRTLSYLLAEARAGNVTGLAFVAIHPGQHFSTGVIGRSRDAPTLTRGMIRQLEDEVGQLYFSP